MVWEQLGQVKDENSGKFIFGESPLVSIAGWLGMLGGSSQKIRKGSGQALSRNPRIFAGLDLNACRRFWIPTQGRNDGLMSG